MCLHPHPPEDVALAKAVAVAVAVAMAVAVAVGSKYVGSKYVKICGFEIHICGQPHFSRATAVVLPQTRVSAVRLPHEGAVRGGARSETTRYAVVKTRYAVESM